MKKKGFDIESSELESGSSIKKLLLVGMKSSIKVMQLKSARDGKTKIKVNEVFTESEIDCLKILNEECQGVTEKQKNPHDKTSLSWASWIIARIGGWKGYASQRPPGTIIFKRGFEKFELMMLGVQIAEKSRDVYKR